MPLALTRYLVSLEYREEEGGNVTHDGHRYDLNTLFALAEDAPETVMPVKELAWILAYEPFLRKDTERLKVADLKAPLLIVRHQGRWVVLDGAHRLYKAVYKAKVKEVPVKILTQDEVDKARL